MAIVKVGTLTVVSGGAAQNLNLGFIPSVFEMQNLTNFQTPANDELVAAKWYSSMSNGTALATNYTGTQPAIEFNYLSSNGFTPYQTSLGSEWVPLTGLPAAATNTNLTITGISKAANASITATHAFTSADIGVTTVTFHGIVGMTQMNTLSGVIQSVTSTTSFTVNINSTNFSTYTSGGIANVITGVPPTTTSGFQVFNTPQKNLSFIGLTLGTSLMTTTNDVWMYTAILDTPVTS